MSDKTMFKVGDRWVADNEIQTAPFDPYADYPNGKPQYDADVETLERAGALSQTASDPDWGWCDDAIYVHGDCGDALVMSPANHGWSGAACLILEGESDKELIINAARVASALARFMPWALARLGDKS